MKPIEEIKPGLFVQETKPGKYKVVHPIRNTDGSINWKNLIMGSNLLMVIIVVGITVVLYSLYVRDINSLRAIVEDPCRYCLEGVKANLPNVTSTIFNPF